MTKVPIEANKSPMTLLTSTLQPALRITNPSSTMSPGPAAKLQPTQRLCVLPVLAVVLSMSDGELLLSTPLTRQYACVCRASQSSANQPPWPGFRLGDGLPGQCHH